METEANKILNALADFSPHGMNNCSTIIKNEVGWCEMLL
jgi:hypothetical protein